MANEVIFPPSGALPFSTVISFLHFWFTIITPTILADTGRYHFLDEIMRTEGGVDFTKASIKE